MKSSKICVNWERVRNFALSHESGAKTECSGAKCSRNVFKPPYSRAIMLSCSQVIHITSKSFYVCIRDLDMSSLHELMILRAMKVPNVLNKIISNEFWG